MQVKQGVADSLPDKRMRRRHATGTVLMVI
jgi:hypothetical protein